MIPASLAKFFALVFALSVPFWVLGALTDNQILPGLPRSALMVLAPVTAAGMLVARSGGRAPLARFIRLALDLRKMTWWAWFVAIATMPLIMLASGLWLIATGHDLPPFEFRLADLAILFVLFLLAATAEEHGWTGYASRPLFAAQGLLAAGAVLGCVAALWHIIPLLQAGRSWDWIAWWALGTVARRIVILALYMSGGGSVFAASLFHAMTNVSWMAFPVMGSHFHPPSVGVISVCLAIIVLVMDRKCRTPSLGQPVPQGGQDP